MFQIGKKKSNFIYNKFIPKGIVLHAEEGFLWFLKPLQGNKFSGKGKQWWFGIYCTWSRALNIHHHQWGVLLENYIITEGWAEEGPPPPRLRPESLGGTQEEMGKTETARRFPEETHKQKPATTGWDYSILLV